MVRDPSDLIVPRKRPVKSGRKVKPNRLETKNCRKSLEI